MIRRAFMAAIGAAIAAPLAWLWPRKSCVDVGPEMASSVETWGHGLSPEDARALARPVKMSTWWWKIRDEWKFSYSDFSELALLNEHSCQIAGYAEWNHTLSGGQLNMLKAGVTPTYFERAGLLLYVPGHHHA